MANNNAGVDYSKLNQNIKNKPLPTSTSNSKFNPEWVKNPNPIVSPEYLSIGPTYTPNYAPMDTRLYVDPQYDTSIVPTPSITTPQGLQSKPTLPQPTQKNKIDLNQYTFLTNMANSTDPTQQGNAEWAKAQLSQSEYTAPTPQTPTQTTTPVKQDWEIKLDTFKTNTDAGVTEWKRADKVYSDEEKAWLAANPGKTANDFSQTDRAKQIRTWQNQIIDGTKNKFGVSAVGAKINAQNSAAKIVSDKLTTIDNFVNTLKANRDASVRNIETSAEQQRTAINDRMFQNWLATRQAMTGRGMTGSGIAQDANTRLGLAGQQQLAQLFTNLANQKFQIDQTYTLKANEQAQLRAAVEQSMGAVTDQELAKIYDSAVKAAKGEADISQVTANIAKTQAQTAQIEGNITGKDPRTGLPTQAAIEFDKNYTLKVADIFGFDPVSGVPTLDQRKFDDSQKQAKAKAEQSANDKIAKATTKAEEDAIKTEKDSFLNTMNRLKVATDESYRAYQDELKIYADIPENKRTQADNARVNEARNRYLDASNRYIIHVANQK